STDPSHHLVDSSCHRVEATLALLFIFLSPVGGGDPAPPPQQGGIVAPPPPPISKVREDELGLGRLFEQIQVWQYRRLSRLRHSTSNAARGIPDSGRDCSQASSRKSSQDPRHSCHTLF